MIQGLSAADEDLVRKVLEKFPQVQTALVFGSRAMGNFKPGSDIDIALKGRLDLTALSRLRARLEEELPLPQFFDLVAYDLIDHPDLKDHIDHYGCVFYEKPSKATNPVFSRTV